MNNKPYWTSYMKTPKRGERERESSEIRFQINAGRRRKGCRLACHRAEEEEAAFSSRDDVDRLPANGKGK